MTPFSVSHDCKISCFCGHPPADWRLDPTPIYTPLAPVRLNRTTKTIKHDDTRRSDALTEMSGFPLSPFPCA